LYFGSSIFSNFYIPDERIGYIVHINTPNPFNNKTFLSIGVVDLKIITFTFQVWISKEVSPEECQDGRSCLELAERLIFEKIGHTIERPITLITQNMMRSKEIERLFWNRRKRV
jgi:hypothetical protein